MKKIFATILAASMMLMGTTAFAQVSVGAGYVNSTSKVTYTNNVHNTPSNGFYAGLGYDINEGAGFGISTGAYFSYLVNNSSAAIASIVSGSSKLTETYLDIPVRANLSMDLSSGLRAFVFAGPVFSCGISSTTDSSAAIAGVEIGTGKRDNYADGSYKRFDILVGGGVGVDFNNSIRVSVSYDLGMLNRVDTQDYTRTRNVLKAGVAFLF